MNLKRTLSVIIVSIIALATVSTANAYQFSSYLQVGASGADVSALQQWLIGKGFSIPAISSGAAQTGYFGQQTKNAVIAYQASVGLPNTGFVGPLTIAKLNMGGGVVVNPGPVQCPIGYTCTVTNPGTVPPISGTPGSITTPGIAGSLAVSLQSTPSNGTSVDKGQNADVVRYKLQAGDSDMLLQSLSLDFDTRFWLYASSITLKDDSGAVIGQINNLGQNNFTELTVGTQYRLRIPTSYVIPRGATRYVTANVQLLPVTDRSAATISITRVETRAIDGTGVTDTQSLTSTRTFAFTGGNTSQIVVTLNNTYSPPNMLVQISTSAETENVLMGSMDIRSQARDGLLRGMTLLLSTSVNNTVAITDVLSDVKLRVGDKIYSADSIGPYNSGIGFAPVVFTNLDIPLPKDQIIPIMVLVDVEKDTGNALDGIAASTTMVLTGTGGGTSNNPIVEDISFNTIAVNSGFWGTSEISFSASNAGVDYTAPALATLGVPVLNNNTTTAYPVSFAFSITAGDNTLYVSNDPRIALSTSTTGYSSNTVTNASSTLTDVTASPGTLSGDTSTYYIIPAGSSRGFVWRGTVKYEANRPGLKTFAITGIKYGTTTGNLVANTIVYYNYASLKVSPVF